MIQRKQTLYLLIASLFAFTYLFGSPVISEITGIVKGKTDTETLTIRYAQTSFTQTDGQEQLIEGSNNFLVFTLTVIGGLGLLCIFLFKRRKLQLRFVSYLIMFDLLLLFLIYYQNKLGVKVFETAETSWKIYAFLPAILPLLHVLALRGIIHDIKLLKAVDRLR